MSTALNVDPNAEIREVELPEEEVDMDEKKDAKEEKEEKKDKYDEIVFSTRKTRKFEVKINQVIFFFFSTRGVDKFKYRFRCVQKIRFVYHVSMFLLKKCIF